jgi:hypothetical protein
VVVIEPGCFRTTLWTDALRDLARRERSHYGRAYRLTSGRLRALDRVMGDPRRVATTVVRALTARRPRARYVVGWDARPLLALERSVPLVLRDRIKRRLFGL